MSEEEERKRLSPAQIRRIVEAYQAGCSLRDIARQMRTGGVNIAHQAIHAIVRGRAYRAKWERGGAPILSELRPNSRTSPRLPEAVVLAARGARERGLPIHEILRLYGINLYQYYHQIVPEEERRAYRRRKTSRKGVLTLKIGEE